MQSDQERHGPFEPAPAGGEVPTTWDPAAVPGDPTVSSADDTESYEHRLTELDTALAEVERALRRLDEGTYGACEVCGRPTEPETEEAPSAGLRCSEHR